MLPAIVGRLPEWLLAGIGLGGVLALLVAAVFAVGTRHFPGRAAGAGGPEGGERRRREEIRQYLRTVGEPFEEDGRIAGERVAFLLPEREVAITFDAQTYFRLERSGIVAVLVEHELPGAHIGARLPFDAPTIEADSAASADPAFAALGLPPSASGEEVRAAYRERVKEVHPDHGGDEEAFKQLREAYDAAREHAD